MRIISVALVSSFALAAPAMAQDRSFNFSLGAAVGAAPEYMGSDTYGGVVTPSFKFGSLNWGSVNAGNGVRAIPDNGVSFKGAFKVLGERTAEDSPELAGLEDIDLAVELGFGVTLQQTNWMAFGEVRKGVTGHSGVTGTLGADWIVRPNDRWLFTAGPRINFGNDEYANTYFGVSGADNFVDYTAGGGALSAGVEMKGTYFIDDKWALEGTVSYEKLMNDAADSPLTVNGSEDQWRIGLGVSRVFTLNF